MPRALVVAALLAAASVARAGDYQVIVHPGVALDSVDKEQLSRLFLKKTSRWPDGQAVVPMEPPERSPARVAFCEDVHGKSAATIKAYWGRLVFSGREVAPMEKSSDDELVAAVRATPGAIGYVSPGASTAGVKVVQVH